MGVTTFRPYVGVTVCSTNIGTLRLTLGMLNSYPVPLNRHQAIISYAVVLFRSKLSIKAMACVLPTDNSSRYFFLNSLRYSNVKN